MKFAASCFFCMLAVAAADPFQGDWEGVASTQGGDTPLAAQVVAEGEGRYRVNLLRHFDRGETPLAVLQGQASDGRLSARSGEPDVWTLVFEDARAVGSGPPGDQVRVHLKKVERLSPELGRKPPPGADVLLGPEGGLKAWQAAPDERKNKEGEPGPAPWKLLPDGVMEVVPGARSVCTRKTYGDFQLHLEFKLPLMADKRGQGRANSGVYIYSIYETQILDSYGLEALVNGCGALYRKKPPSVNMSAPPGQWQSFDITFTAPRFDAGGKKSSNARITVVHNGATVQSDVELSRGTGNGAGKPEQPRGWIKLQDHGNRVQFRNMWIVEGRVGEGEGLKPGRG